MAAFNVFCSLRTQWRMGLNGPTGLHYDSLPLMLRLQRVPRADWPEVLAGVQAMEYETLRLLRDKR